MKLNIILILVIVGLLVALQFYRNKLQDKEVQYAELEERYKAKFEFKPSSNSLNYVTSSSNTANQSIYVPSEGSATVSLLKEGEKEPEQFSGGLLNILNPLNWYNNFTSNTFYDEEAGVSVVVKNGGFCFNPAISVTYREGIEPQFQFRFLFKNRFGMGLGIDTVFDPFVFIDYKLDRIIPSRNLSLGVQYSMKEKYPKVSLSVYIF